MPIKSNVINNVFAIMGKEDDDPQFIYCDLFLGLQQEDFRRHFIQKKKDKKKGL